MRIKTLAPLLGLVLMWMTLPVANLSAQEEIAPVEVRVLPVALRVAPGEQVDLAIEIVAVEALYGFDVVLTFDPAVVEVVDADPEMDGVQVSLGTFLEPGFAVRNTADNSTGRLQFAMTQLNPSEAKSGTGTLIVVKLAGKQVDASSALSLEKAQLARRDGIEIPSILVPGQVDVTSSVVGQATNTPLPTQAAGVPLPTPGPTATGDPAASAVPATSQPATAPAQATGAPTSQAGEAQPTSATASTALPATPEPGAQTPVEPAPTSVSPEISQTQTTEPPAVTPVPGAAVEATATLEAVAVQVETVEPSSDAAVQGEEETSAVSRILLLGSVGALCLAAVGLVAVAALIFYWRGSSSQ